MLNGVRDGDAVDLLSTQTINGDPKIDNHPSRRIRGSGVGHLEQPVGERALGRNDLRNRLGRVVRVLESLLHQDDDLREGWEIHGALIQVGSHVAQEFEG